jgi:hypothetical protein
LANNLIHSTYFVIFLKSKFALSFINVFNFHFRWQLVRVSEDFRVIALGLPVPQYIGNPLDPPLRSRFQVNLISLKILNFIFFTEI